MEKYNKQYTLSEFAKSTETIKRLHCTSCGVDIEFEGTKAQACNEFYAQGWRITELDIMCLNCHINYCHKFG